MKLYLIRHAQSTANVRQVLDTALPGPSLTELGHRQATELVATMADVPLVAVYSSHATRAMQTAAPLVRARSFELQLLDGVQEISVGRLEGRGDDEALHAFMSTVTPWTRGELDGAMPGGESGRQVRERYLAAVAAVRAKHEQADPRGAVAVVSHGGAIRLGAEWLADNVRPEVADKGLLANTAAVVLETRPDGRWTCLDWAGLSM